MPADAEARLASFTELVATAIANAESHAALTRLVEEQAALRRVATAVAQGVPPAEIFSAVSDEVARLFGSQAGVLRFEPDGPAVVFVGVSKTLELPVGTRWEFQPGMASAEVYRTGGSARVDAMDWSSASGPVAGAARRMGIVSSVASPIVVEGRLWGAMNIASIDELLPFGLEGRLEKFTELLATAIANAESRSELAASRRRIVAASDEARRRIERDLHDGTQQRLVSLGLAARIAEADVAAGLGDLRAELSRIAAGLADAVAELQEFSRGIHPAILSERGLGPALRTLARRSAVPVDLDVTTNARFPEPIEIAAYYVASEALANAMKHAQASHIEMSLTTRNGSLLLSIRDDGVGGANPARGSGLAGLTDRVEALGGSIHLHSAAGAGTRITVDLPLEHELAGAGRLTLRRIGSPGRAHGIGGAVVAGDVVLINVFEVPAADAEAFVAEWDRASGATDPQLQDSARRRLAWPADRFHPLSTGWRAVERPGAPRRSCPPPGPGHRAEPLKRGVAEVIVRGAAAWRRSAGRREGWRRRAGCVRVLARVRAGTAE